MEIRRSEKTEKILEIIKSLTPPEMAEVNKAIEEEFDIQGGSFASSTTQNVEDKKPTGTVNASLKILEVGSQAIHVYGTVKDIVNAVTSKQINIINAKQMIDKKEPVLENIPKQKAEDYKKQLEEKGAKVELIEV